MHDVFVISIKGKSPMSTIPDDNLVQVVCSSNHQWLPLVGKTVGTVKKSLREVFSIAYFADPWVNGHLATLSDRLSAGDSLEFIRPFGFKGGETQQDYPLAEALITADSELQNIRKHIRIENLSNVETLLLVTEHFIQKYGDPGKHEQPVFQEVARQLIVTAVALRDLHKSGQTIELVKNVHFDPLSHIFFVKGKEKRGLSEPQMDVLQALYEAGEKGLSKTQLELNSGHSDARGILKRLIKDDPDWAAVIHFPGKAHRGYRLG